MYKVFAGYGEKPAWSALWFGVSAFAFSFLYMMVGFRNSEGKIIQYGLDFSCNGFQSLINAETWGDWGSCLLYSLYRVIPTNYLPFPRIDIVPATLIGSLLAVVNSVILLLLVTFIGVGLKRTFRRF